MALHPVDAEAAQEGGADRLHVFAWSDGQARSVEPAAVSAIVRSVDIPVRVTLRLSDGFSTSGGELTRLLGLAGEYLSLGVEGFVFGFLTTDLDIDVEICGALAEATAGAPWTFDRSFDSALDTRRAWRKLLTVAGVDSVHTAGAALGMGSGVDDLISLAIAEPAFGSAAVAAGKVQAEHIPWLVRAGISRVHLGATVRPGGSWAKAHVDAGFVRSWRLLLDDAIAGQAPRSGLVG